MASPSKTVASIFAALLFVFVNSGRCEAGFLYHAAKKASLGKILKGGFNPAKFRPNTRLGRGAYLSRRPSTSLAERGQASSVIRMRGSKTLGRNLWDLRKPNSERLHGLLGREYDLRGAVKKNVIGPKTGRTLGKLAGDRGKAIEYRSVRTGGSNLFIPKKLFQKHPRVVRPDRIQ